jgi:hypothetical protein
MSSLSGYKNHVYANLPAGMTTANGKFTYNNRRFNNFPEANRYRSYLLRHGG